MNAGRDLPVKLFMKTSWMKKIQRGLLIAGLAGAGVGLVGCADEYAAYPGYHGGYYAGYSSAPYPYYGGYGYPYRAYGPYYGGYYGGPYYGYGSPYYGSSRVVVSGSRTSSYRDQYGRVHYRRPANRVRTTGTTGRTTTTTTTHRRTPNGRTLRYDNDDERRYYARPQ